MGKLFAASVATLIIACVAGWAVSDTQARAAVAPPPRLRERRHRSLARVAATQQFGDFLNLPA